MQLGARGLATEADEGTGRFSYLLQHDSVVVEGILRVLGGKCFGVFSANGSHVRNAVLFFLGCCFDSDMPFTPLLPHAKWPDVQAYIFWFV